MKVSSGFVQIQPGEAKAQYNRLVNRGIRNDLVPRIMDRRADVFTNEPGLKKLIAHRLGWVDVASAMIRRISAIERFGQLVLRDGLRHIVLIGMGGSSLCPEVFGKIFGKLPRVKSYQIIDSTDPAAVRSVLRKIELTKTLFIVASKSGGTIETRSHEAFFMNCLIGVGVRKPGKHFTAITDSGSDLHKFARKHGYRKVFLNPSDIGGRFSALSYFGLVPAYFTGVDLRRLLGDAIVMEKTLRQRDDETNPALVLGALMAGSAQAGMGKMTALASKKTAPFVAWVEQLVAESTGKKGKGVVPVEAEPIGKPSQYGKDRLFVSFRLANERSAGRVSELKRHKYPFAEIVLSDKHELGGQFLLWEAATAVAGQAFGINPFDEPNVTESKDLTRSILADLEKSGRFPSVEPTADWNGLKLLTISGMGRCSKADKTSLSRFLRRFFSGARPPKYLSLLCFFKSDRRTEAALDHIRRSVRDKTRMASLRGYGPRYLHSVGQLYKGGPAEGLFVVFVRTKYGRLEIPGKFFDFGQLVRAQGMGDAKALQRRNLRTAVIAIDGNPAEGLEKFAQVVSRALR